MAHFEEKILAYLDGSLPEAEREDVLAGISGEHTSERALFDAHLRLQDLYSVVRKPVSAPLSVQRELAAQIPVLAIKLPYLIAPTERRNRFAAGWLSSMRSSWVNVFLLLAAALLTGGVWYAVTSHSHHAASFATNIAPGESQAGGTPNAHSGNASQNVASTNASMAHARASRIDLSYPARDNNRSSMPHSNTAHSIAHPANRSSANSSAGMSSMSAFGTRNVSANRNTNRIANLKGASTIKAIRNNNSETLSNNNVPAVVSSLPAANAPSNENPAKPAGINPPELPSFPIHSVDIIEQPVNFHPQRDIFTGYPTDDNTSGFVPLRVYAFEGERFIVPMPASKLSSFVTETKQGIIGNAEVQSAEAGVEYEITPWTSAGVHMGYTSFAQYQSFTHTQSSTITRINSQYLDAAVQMAPAFWTALAVTQTFNPQDRAQCSISFAGGPAFTAPVAWLGMIEPSITYDLSSTFMFRGGVSYDIIQVKQSLQNTSASPNETSGIIIASSGGTLRSNAIGFNLGFSFHP
jgi:hypothetical protein